jgi:hypothetical protein
MRPLRIIFLLREQDRRRCIRMATRSAEETFRPLPDAQLLPGDRPRGRLEIQSPWRMAGKLRRQLSPSSPFTDVISRSPSRAVEGS